MNFLNPLVLLALAAALVPLLLHFLTLRRLRPFPFSSVRFLKELQRSAARRFRLRQLLLLAVRMGLIASIVLAFARPVLPGAVPLLGDRAPASIVLVVDNSASMGVADALGERFRRLQQVAERLLRSLKADDEVALLPVVPVRGSLSETWGTPRGALLQMLSRLTPQPERGELLQALRRAAVLVRDARHFHRFVVIVSDFQKSALTELSREQQPLFDAQTTVVALPIGDKDALRAGIVIDSVALESQLRTPYSPVTLTVRARAFGQGTAHAVVSLFWDGTRVSQQPLTLREGEVHTLSLSGIPKRSGFFRAEIVAEGDVHSIGNRRLAGFALREGPSVKIVLDDAFAPLFESALNASAHALFVFERTTLAQVSSLPPGSGSVLLLASSNLSALQLEWLKTFVLSGGNLFLFLPDKPSAVLSTWLAGLGLTLQWHELSSAEAATITWVDRQHPLFAGVFQGSGEHLPETPRLEKFATITGGMPLMKSTLGAVLVEHAAGRGRLLLCGIVPNISWSEFPRSGLFPTTVVRGLLLLGSATVPALLSEVGERVALTLGTAPPTLIVREPDGTRRTLAPVMLSAGARVELGQLQLAGVYELFTPNGTPVATVTANIPTAELQLSSATPEEVQKWFRQLLNPATPFRYIPTPEESAAIAVEGSQATELWRYFLVLALLLAALEVALSRSGQHELQT